MRLDVRRKIALRQRLRRRDERREQLRRVQQSLPDGRGVPAECLRLPRRGYHLQQHGLREHGVGRRALRWVQQTVRRRRRALHLRCMFLPNWKDLLRGRLRRHHVGPCPLRRMQHPGVRPGRDLQRRRLPVPVGLCGLRERLRRPRERCEPLWNLQQSMPVAAAAMHQRPVQPLSRLSYRSELTTKPHASSTRSRYAGGTPGDVTASMG